MLGKFGTPSYNSSHECRVKWLFRCATGILPRVLRDVDVQPSTELSGIEKGKAGVNYLKVHLDKIQCKSMRGSITVSARRNRVSGVPAAGGDEPGDGYRTKAYSIRKASSSNLYAGSPQSL